ncbi:hypothetical protein FHG64_05100 [Antarcticibacterium flavum]|uniref:Histidine kinase domain-containing protein n=1 Tax=Antarcticibacterium flavum TaxID=2058175 RepID=A0A5B7X011_9FLAO|nr:MULTISPECIES: sensor histidine kinase [Antarcticibacterium]MCM4159820.1 hypothetical protein [Antarcticibacterium sp. W02-3]QCY68826.1 hypothetical protein FHG64_05100 [Antarcticibacterium flavum]
MGNRRGLILFYLLFNSFLSIPQQENFVFKNITINEGLSQNSVIDIAEDPSGFMWFATQEGLNRYDGKNFLVFPVAFDDITTPDNAQLGKLLATPGKLWMIKRGGKVAKLDLYTHKFTPLSLPGYVHHNIPAATYLYNDKSGRMWIGTLQDGAILINKNNSLEHYSPEAAKGKKLLHSRIRAIYEDSNKNIWILTPNGLTGFKGDQANHFLKGINSNVITETADKTLWLGSLGNGIYRRGPEDQNFQKFTGYEAGELPEDLVVETIYADGRNRIWVGTYGKGLFVINTAARVIKNLMPNRQDPKSINFQDVLSVKEDSRGGIWIGTDGGGVSYFDEQFNTLRTITAREVKENISIEQIRAITTTATGRIWLGTSGQGLTSFDPKLQDFATLHLSPYKPGISNYDRVVSLQVDGEGDLWIGTQGNGLIILDSLTGNIKKWFTTDAVEAGARIECNTQWVLIPAGRGQMWVATRSGGLLLIDKELGMQKQYLLPSQGNRKLKAANLQALMQLDEKTLVLGYEEEGIYLLDILGEKFNRVNHPLIEETLRGETGIKSFFYEDGWLWAGTAGRGILLIHLETGRTQLLDDSNFLHNNMIYGILPGQKGRVWVSSNRGLFKLDYYTTSLGPEIRQLQHFTVTDGLQSNEFNTGAYHRDQNGNLYFGGISGLTYFNPSKISSDRNELPVVLTGAMVGNKPVSTDTVITYLTRLSLPYNQNSLSFNYTVLDYLSADNTLYQYMLEGYDEDWVDAMDRNYTAYTNLPSADYIFRVRVANKAGSRAPLTSLIISIAVPFWKQWWFLLLVGVLLMAFIYGLHKYRVYQLLRVQRVKNNISADLHDDLGARLTNIQVLSAISRRKLGVDKPEAMYLQKIEEEVEASARALDEIVWNIKMKDESLEEIVAKMRRYAGETLDGQYDFQIEVKGKFRKKRMSMQKRRELFLVFKELLNNIKKHARATRIYIRIAIENDHFVMEFKDDGCGFDTTQESSRNGLKNIRERVNKWKGRISLESQHNKGTHVLLHVPFDRRSFSISS